jgi:tRNA nucleotidyltransferase (CCA-adding enzyme)
MTSDQYVRNVLSKYEVNRFSAERAAKTVAPAIRQWAGSSLSDLYYSGSFAKGTGNSLSTDVDLFISLNAHTPKTLKQIFYSLYSAVSGKGWLPRVQNVSSS